MKTSELKSGYLVANDDNPVCIYSNIEDAEDHIKFQKEYLHSKKNWYIIEIKLSNWKTFKYDQEIPSL